ncbi:MAG: VapE domain-containing protein [Phocaeicola sp.]
MMKSVVKNVTDWMQRVTFLIHYLSLKKEVNKRVMPTVATPSSLPRKTKGETKSGEPLADRLERYLCSRYQFRFNLLSEQPEYADRTGSNPIFSQVTQRVLNSLCMEAQAVGIACWDKDVTRLLYSFRLNNYHPLLHYLEQLPKWDGIDRITPLAHRISTDELWVAGFRCWLLGMTVQWMGKPAQCANSVAPLLISTKQGWGKSTFCSLLMPDQLKSYYTDSFELTGQLGCEQKLAYFGLINLDEFDRLSIKKLPLLKNLMQMRTINFRKAHRASFSHMPRMASFIGTSNQPEILADASGSRRYLCMELTHPIDATPLAHKQLFAQLKALLAMGERYWLTKEEEGAWQKRNERFSRLSSAQSLFFRTFAIPQDEETYQLFTGAAIYSLLKKRYPIAMSDIKPGSFSRLLLSWGIERVHSKMGNQFKVVVLTY